MTENKRFRKMMGFIFIQDTTCEGGDVEGVMDLTDIEDMLNRLNDDNEQLKLYNGEMEDYLARLEEENEQLKKQLDGQPLKLEDDDNKSDRINMNYKELDFIIRTFRDLNNLSYSELLLIKDFCNNLKEDKNNLFLIQENND